MGLSSYEKLRIAQDLANGEMRFKIEEVEFIEQALIKAKAIEPVYKVEMRMAGCGDFVQALLDMVKEK